MLLRIEDSRKKSFTYVATSIMALYACRVGLFALLVPNTAEMMAGSVIARPHKHKAQEKGYSRNHCL